MSQGGARLGSVPRRVLAEDLVAAHRDQPPRDHWRSRASTEAEIHQPWTQADDLRLADRQDSPALTLERRQVLTCLGDLFAQLRPGEREALILAVRDAMPPREIARTLRLAPEAARARRKLAAMVIDRCTLVADEAGALSCEVLALPAASMIPSSGRISPV
jgi:hypothetical protein